MGWKERDWYLGPHARAALRPQRERRPDRLVGRPRRRRLGRSARTGEIVFRILEDVGADGDRAVEAEAARLAAWLGDVRLAPGFLPPFQRALSGLSSGVGYRGGGEKGR